MSESSVAELAILLLGTAFTALLTSVTLSSAASPPPRWRS